MVHRFVSEIVFGNLINLKIMKINTLQKCYLSFSNIYCIVPPFLTQKCCRPSFANSDHLLQTQKYILSILISINKLTILHSTYLIIKQHIKILMHVSAEIYSDLLTLRLGSFLFVCFALTLIFARCNLCTVLNFIPF